MISNIYLIAQEQANVSTPKGSNVVAYKPEEMSSSDRAYWDNYYANAYPNASQINTYGPYSSSMRFNCHGYAWYMVESGSGLNTPRWIGYYSTTAEDIYMSDGSYVQVKNEMYPGKVSWGSGDHSAITTSQSGVFKSKWNKYPLFEHDWDDTPYGTNNLKYYVSTNINGSSSVLCNNSTRTFTTTNIPGASYSWSVGNGLTLNSNGNYSTSVTANSYYSGSSWIIDTITSPLSGNNNDVKISKKKTFWVGKPQVYTLGNNLVDLNGTPKTYFCYDQANECEAVNIGGDAHITAWEWRVTGGTVYPYGAQNRYATIYPNSYSTFMVEIRAHNACGWTDWARMWTEVEDCYGYNMVFSPNPTTGETTLSIESDSKKKSVDETAEWEFEVYNPNQTIKEKRTNLKGSSTTIQTQSWKEGVYVVRVKFKPDGKTEKILTGKLMVKK